MQLINRKTRYAYTGKIRLLVPYDPWRLMFTLNAMNLSQSGFLASFDLSKTNAQMTKDDANVLFTEGDDFFVQLEHEFPDTAFPFLKATIRRKIVHLNSLDLAFSFAVDDDPDILSMMQDMSQKSAQTWK